MALERNLAKKSAEYNASYSFLSELHFKIDLFTPRFNVEVNLGGVYFFLLKLIY